MQAITEVGNYLIQTVVNLLLFVVLLRAVLCAVRADYYNPITQLIVRITGPVLNPMRKLLPTRGRLDLAAILLAIVLQAIGIVLAIALYGAMVPISPRLLLWACIGVLGLLINIYFFALLAMIIVSWVAAGSRHPAILLLWQITEPVMAPFRRVLPPLGGLDLSPILVFILINVLQITLRNIALSVGLHPALVLGL